MTILPILLCLACLLPPLAGDGRAQGTSPGGGVRVHSFELKGVKGVSEQALRSVLVTKAPGWLPWSDEPLFNRQEFEADLHRIRAFYVDHGFPDAEVASFDIDLDEEGNSVDLSVTVDEGQPTLVEEVRFEGFEDVPSWRLRRARRNLPVQPGQPLDRTAVATAREMLAGDLRDQGYPYARVGARLEHLGGNRLAVVLTAEPGELARFGETTIMGEQSVGESVIRRSMLFQPGDLYRQSAIEETQRKLYALELFDFVNVAPVRQVPQPGAAEVDVVQPSPTGTAVVPMRITVTESKHSRLRMSAGYGTEDKARAEARYRRLNFLGGGRSAGLHAKWSSLDRGLSGDFLQPFLFGPRWSFSLNGRRWYSDEPSYRAVESGGHVTLTYGPGLRTTFSLTATSVFQSSRITREALADLSLRDELIALGLDPRTGGQDGTLDALSFDFRRNTAQPSPLNAVRGNALALHLEWAGGPLQGSYSYANVSLDASHYRRIPGGVVLAARVQAGSIAPRSGVSANVPFFKRYFLGGATSIRGWGRYQVSPLSGSGLPLGGFSMFQATAEARFGLFGDLGGVLFLDAGNVWEKEWRLVPDDLRYAVGPGLRYNTPVGPVRVDVGYQLNPIPGLLVNGEPQGRRWRLHFSIGQAF